MVEVSTSVLSVKQGEEVPVFLALEKAKTDYFHIDVMDGKFVEKNTYSEMLSYAQTIKRISNLPLDVHFMVKDVEQAINDFSAVCPNQMTFHYEVSKTPEEILARIQKIKECHAKVGLSVKPETNVEEIYPYLPYIHTVLIMTVEPGKGGQTLLTDMVEKIKQLKRYCSQEEIEIDIEVDGGINLRTAPLVKQAGANILVAGTAILMANNYQTIIQELKET